MSPTRNAIVAFSVNAAVVFAAHLEDPRQVKQEYDFVIAGAGAGGFTAANRLTDDPIISVLMVEYGQLADRERMQSHFSPTFLIRASR